jgi:hypothetical protein
MPLQGTSCDKSLDNGFPLQIHQRIIILHVVFTTKAPQHGLLKAVCLPIGKTLVPSYGYMGIVRPLSFCTFAVC